MYKNKITRIPRYQQIENDLIDKINAGIYVTDDLLPTEHELAKEYGCSRVTVRQALKNLSHKGMISTTQGSGSYVNKQKMIQRTPLLKSFTEDMMDLGKTPSSHIKTFNIIEAGNTLATILGINSTDQIYYVERTRFADGVPVLFEKTYMSTSMHPELSLKVLQGSKYQYGDNHNLSVDHAYQNIAPIFPPEYIANELNLPLSQPILRVANTTYMADGNIFDYTELYMHPELYQLNIVKKR